MYAARQIRRQAIVTQAAHPGQTIAQFGHDALVGARVALPVFPNLQCRHALGQTGDHVGREDGPIARVDAERQAGGLADGSVVIDESVDGRVDVRRRQDEQRVGARLFHAARHRAGDRSVDAHAAHHGHLGGRFGDADDLHGLLNRKRIELARAARSDHGAEGMLAHQGDIFLKRGIVHRQVGRTKRRDGEPEHAAELIAKFGHM